LCDRDIAINFGAVVGEDPYTHVKEFHMVYAGMK